MMVQADVRFRVDSSKDSANRTKHGIGFELAQQAFLDPLRVIAEDLATAAVSRATSVSAGLRVLS
jgi:uncharacterized DUF497 family protein